MAQYHTSFKFDAVVVIDSLPRDEEPQTGEWLRDEVLKPLADSNGFTVWYLKVENSAQLSSALPDVDRLVREAGHVPIVHFEAHGTEGAMQLADKTLVSWRSLKDPLTSINRACRMNLLAVMSMCHGAHLISQLQAVDISPVWALIGPVPEILPCRLQEAFHAFYRKLFSSLDGRAAVQAMNEGREGSPLELKIEMAEIWFCKIWRQYEQTRCTPEELKARENELVATVMRRSGYDLGHAMAGRAYAKESLSDNERHFYDYRRTFMMLDLFPENEGRFPLTYQNCVQAA